MLDLTHGAAALVFLGVGKQLGVVIDEHGEHIGAGVEVFLRVVLEVVIIHQRDDGKRLLGGGGVHQKDGVMPPVDDDIPALGAAFGPPVHFRHQLRHVAAEQLLPGENGLLGGRVAPHDLAGFPDDQGGHGEIEDGIAHDVLQRVLQLGEAAAVLPGDDGHPDDAADGQQHPCADADIKDGQIVAGGDGCQKGTRRDEHRKDRTVLVQSLLHNVPPFRLWDRGLYLRRMRQGRRYSNLL